MSGRRKVLLVDDSRTILMLEQSLLAGLQIDVVTALDGAEGVEKAAAVQPDIIFMDVRMPKMSGLEACRAIREREDTRHIPVVLVTTLGDTASVEAGYAAGCTDYITKPIDKLELLAKLKQYVDRDHADDSGAEG